ncbi:hypothetical protein RS030_111876 [Cryptosporidium xiaoi]|uniref:Uncharacterized protein n=1 Tax=Cryptosporidium xiaoi TaxID=659607 RepID=A0AAV9Y358_9CRYT
MIDEIVLLALKITKYKVENMIISEYYLENIEFIVLSILEKYILNKWDKFTNQEKIRIRDNLLLISIQEYNPVVNDSANNNNNICNMNELLIYSNSAIRKLSYTIGLVIINDNFVSWKIFLNNILKSRNIIKKKNNLDIKVDKLTRLIFGIVNEIIDSLLITSNLKLDSKARVSIIHGIRNEVEPILHLLSNDIKEIIDLITKNDIYSNNNNNNFIINRIKLCFYTLKNLTNIIDSTHLIKLKLDELLINILLSSNNLNVDDDIIDLLNYLMYNLKKHKKNCFNNLEYEDINRFCIGISKLVRNMVLYPQLMFENPKYDNYLKHICLTELFKDLTELTLNYILKFPDNIIFENYGNKYDTIIHIWNTCILLSLHPSILICDLSISSMTYILKNIHRENNIFLNNIEILNIDILVVIVFIRSIKMGDPSINYNSNEWNEWNIIISNMLTNSLNKLNSEKLSVFLHFPSQIFCYSYIISKYSVLYDQYYIINTENNNNDSEITIQESINCYNSSFHKLFGTLKNRIINLTNSLIDFECGIALNTFVETILNVSTYILSSQTFNKKCEKHLCDNNYSNPNSCKKLLILDVIFFFIETTITRLNFHITNENNDINKNDNNNTISASYCLDLSSSYMDLIINQTDIKKTKKWLISFYSLINGILNLNLIDLCGFNLENRKLSLMYISIHCTEWYKNLYDTNNSCVNIEYYLKTFLYYLSYSGDDNNCKDLRKTSGYLFSKLLLNNSNLFKNYISEIINIIKQALNINKLTIEEKNILTSVLIAVTNATRNYSEIYQFSLIASNNSVEFLLNICNSSNLIINNNLLNESFLEFSFGSLINTLKNDYNNISEENWYNLLQIKNSLNLIYSLFSNVNLPSNYLEAYSGGFIDKINEKILFKHPLEKISVTIFESICFLFFTFSSISSFNLNKEDNVLSNYLYVFNTISDQEWVNRSDIKNINDNRIQKLSKIISYKYIFSKNINTIRRITSSIRNILIKIIVYIFTLGTSHEIVLSEDNNCNSNINFAVCTGLYFDNKYLNLITKTLIEPILTTPIYILNSIIKNGLSKILSPNLIPRCTENDYKIVLFFENVFVSNFIPNIINRLNIEWDNLMKCQTYILQTPLNSDLKCSLPMEDPFSILFKTNIPFKDFTEDLKDNNLLNTIYISHYNDLCEISQQVLKIIDQFFTGYKNQIHINLPNNKNDNSNKCNNYDGSNMKLNKFQSKNIIISNIFYNNERLLSSCFNLLIVFLNYPNSNVLEQSLHIIQKYLKLYNNNLSNMNLNEENFHLNIIQNIVIELLKHSSKYFPFDPLNISQNENSDMNISTPLSSYLLLTHTNLVKNVIQDAISCIIRSNSDCSDFIFKYKDELGKENSSNKFSNEYKQDDSLISHDTIIFTINIPDIILSKAFKSLEFIINRNNEYNPLNNIIISQQDILLISRLFLQDYIQDNNSNSYFSIAIENFLIQVSQLSKVSIVTSNNKNSHFELKNCISVLNFDQKNRSK